jgi:hypothetical protein
MKFFFCCLITFICATVNGQQQNILPVRGPQIKFDTPEIIDTITISDLDTNCMCIAGDNKYIFWFTNIGNEPLRLDQSSGSDPDWNCDWTRELIKPGGRGFVTICAWQGRLRMDKTYRINDNSVISQTIHIKRVSMCDESIYNALNKRYEARREEYYNHENPFRPEISTYCVVTIASLPEPVRSAFKTWMWRDITIDTLKNYYSINSDSVPVSYRLIKGHDVPSQTAFEYVTNGCSSYYSLTGQLLETKEISRKFTCTDKKEGTGYWKTTIVITPYKNGVKGKPVKTEYTSR